MENKLLSGISKLIDFYGSVEAEKVLQRIICNDGGVMTVSPKYRIEKIIEEIDESIKVWETVQEDI